MNIEQLKSRPVIIRKELLDHYSDMGLNETELIILIKLLHSAEISNKQPSIETLQQGSTLDSRRLLLSFNV